MKLSELGEFGLIRLLSEMVLEQRKDRRLLVDIGDDAAAWKSEACTVLATTDTLIQGVHFTPASTAREVGWKAMAINLSDVAAMGGVPQYALVSLAYPPDTEVDEVTQLYEGMAEVAAEFQVAIAGGNVSAAPVAVITITVLGKASDEGILTRSAAVPGDSIAVTGYLGSSAAGLTMLTQGLQFDSQATAFLRRAHLQPPPRVAEGQMLLRQGVRAAIDISDGLLGDLGHLCEASKVGAKLRIDRIPVHPLVRANFPDDALRFALAGGEDYELLFAAPRDVVERVQTVAAVPVTTIGGIVAGPAEVALIDGNGRPFSWDERKGWEHFARSEGS